ncbi:membrane protein [Pontibacter akesuensis]|nr:membrane protein [Pontibacter akesuensis]
MFSNVKFIQVSKDLTASQRNLKELLILLCRILFIVFLVLAFAQPFLPASDTVAGATNAKVSIAVDNSYSMERMHAEEDLTLLNVATDQAKTVVNLFPASTAFQISGTERIKHGAVVQGSEAATLLDQLAYSANTFAMPTASGQEPAHLFVLSDFQKQTFSLENLTSIDAATQVHLVPLAAASTANVTIDSVYLEDEFIRTGADNTLHVLLHNTGAEAAADVPVKLFIQDQQVAALSLDLPPNQVTEAIMTFRTTGTGLTRAYVQVEDYPVEFDNTYYFILAPSAAITVTEVTDDAASLRRLYGSEAFFNFSSYNSGNIDYAKLAISDLVILNGVESLSSALAANLSNYVKEGGSLVVVPPVGQSTGAYASLFQNLNIAASFTGASAASAKTNLAAPDPNNPFFRSIFSEFDAKMQMPVAARSIAWSRASEDILKYRGGASFLSRFDRGNGAVYLLAAPLDDAYSTLPNHALFVPIMYRLAIESYRQQQQLAYTLGSGTIQLPAAPQQSREGVYQLQQDTVAFIPEQQVRGGKLYFNVPAGMDNAGFYTLQLQDSTLTTLAFNYGKEESYLAQYTPDELRALVGEDKPNVHVYDYGDAFSIKGEFEKRYFGVKLWKYCLILCLFFLMAEIALIRFFRT